MSKKQLEHNKHYLSLNKYEHFHITNENDFDMLYNTEKNVINKQLKKYTTNKDLENKITNMKINDK